MVLDMVKSWAQAQFKEVVGEKLADKILGGKKKDPAKEKTAEAAATVKLATAESARALAIGEVTAALWLQYAAQVAVNTVTSGLSLGGGMNTGAPSHIGAGGTTAFGMAAGGTIEEEIIGWGQKSGKKYSLGEAGKEFVVPEKKMGEILAKYGDITRADKIKIEEQMSGRKFEDPMANQNNTRIDNAKLASLAPQTINQTSIKNAPDTISISVPVTVEGNAQLAGKMRSGVEQLIKDIMREEMR